MTHPIGHTPTSEVQASVEEILTRVTLHTVDTVFKDAYIMDKTDSPITILDTLILQRINYPHNCFTLDLSNKSSLRINGIKSLHLGFQNLTNSSIEIHQQGKSLSCNRDILDHSFYSTGSPIVLDKMGRFEKYAVKIKEERFVEQDWSQGCKIYPNTQFSSYRLVFKLISQDNMCK